MGDLLLAYESLIAFVGINGLLALSVYATLCCGQLSLANAGFMAIGAYTGALITLKAPGVPFIAVLTVLPELMRELGARLGLAPGPFRLFLNGAILLAVILYLPNGLVSLPSRLRRRARGTA